MTNGPYLYDDDPEPLHTASPAQRDGHAVAVLVATLGLVAATVVALFVARQSPAEQSEEAVGVFLAALEAEDTETAHQLLCEDERARIDQDEVAAEYVVAPPGRVRASEDVGVEQAVEVGWADGSTSRLLVISESGPRICGSDDAPG